MEHGSYEKYRKKNNESCRYCGEREHKVFDCIKWKASKLVIF